MSQRNTYFSPKVRTEQNLYENILIEQLKVVSQDIYYIKRDIVHRDNIFNEATISKYKDAYKFIGYIENEDGFEGDGEIFSKFGLEIRDDVTFIFSRRLWHKDVSPYLATDDDLKPKPRVGDLIYLTMTNRFFEVTHIEEESPFYQLQNLPVYRVQCSLYEFSHDEIDTNIDEIDDNIEDFVYQETLGVTVTSGNHFKLGETVTQEIRTGVSLSAKVVTIDKESDMSAKITISDISISGEYGDNNDDFVVSSTIGLIGSESNNTCYINKIYTLNDTNNVDDIFPNDDFARNAEIQRESNTIIDFTENNPFGDPNDPYED